MLPERASVKPCVLIYVFPHIGWEEKIREVQAGMEEEGIPCLVVQAEEFDVVAQRCLLDRGSGCGGKSGRCGALAPSFGLWDWRKELHDSHGGSRIRESSGRNRKCSGEREGFANSTSCNSTSSETIN